MPRRRLATTAASAALITVATAASGCARAGSVTAGTDGRSLSASSAPKTPAPTRTIVRNTHVVAAGQSVPFTAQRGITLRLRAGVPLTSRSSLSSSYGYPPSHGYYITFRLTIANTGSKPVQLGPGNFAVVVPGQGRVTSYDGNAPYSGAHAQLDTTQIDPGDVVHAPLSFDVRAVHGRLLFVPDNSAAIVWRY